MRKSALHHKDETQNPGQDGGSNECVLTLKIMDVCPGKVKKQPLQAVPWAPLKFYITRTTPSGPGQRPKFTSIFYKGAVIIYLSASVHIKFIVVALRGFVIMPLEFFQKPNISHFQTKDDRISKNARFVLFLSLLSICFLRYKWSPPKSRRTALGLWIGYLFVSLCLFAETWRGVGPPSLTQCVTDRSISPGLS